MHFYKKTALFPKEKSSYSIGYSLNSIFPFIPDLMVKDGSAGREILTMVRDFDLSTFDWSDSDASASGVLISFTVP